MPRIFVDFTEEETSWNGELGSVEIRDHDGLSGTDMAIGFGDHELVVTVNQLITLYDVLDAWMHAGPLTEVGAVRGRVHNALRELINDRNTLAKAFGVGFTQEQFVHEFEEYVRCQGLRFRMTGDEPAFERKPRGTL